MAACQRRFATGGIGIFDFRVQQVAIADIERRVTLVLRRAMHLTAEGDPPFNMTEQYDEGLSVYRCVAAGYSQSDVPKPGPIAFFFI